MAKAAKKRGRPEEQTDDPMVHFGIRIRQSLKNTLEDLAKKGNRRATDEARAALENHVKVNAGTP